MRYPLRHRAVGQPRRLRRLFPPRGAPPRPALGAAATTGSGGGSGAAAEETPAPQRRRSLGA